MYCTMYVAVCAVCLIQHTMHTLMYCTMYVTVCAVCLIQHTPHTLMYCTMYVTVCAVPHTAHTAHTNVLYNVCSSVCCMPHTAHTAHTNVLYNVCSSVRCMPHTAHWKGSFQLLLCMWCVNTAHCISCNRFVAPVCSPPLDTPPSGAGGPVLLTPELLPIASLVSVAIFFFLRVGGSSPSEEQTVGVAAVLTLSDSTHQAPHPQTHHLPPPASLCQSSCLWWPSCPAPDSHTHARQQWSAQHSGTSCVRKAS